MKPVKTAILGTGVWAAHCLRALRLTRGLELVACHGNDPESLAAFVKQSGLPATRSEEELLDLPGLEAALIMTPNHVHCRQAVAAASRGLHVFVEKPMAPTVEECQTMIAAATARGSVMFVGHHMRREARFRKVAEILDGGEIGSVAFAEINFTSSAGLTRDRSGWRFDTARVPSPGLVQIGVHAIDLMNSILGPAIGAEGWIRNDEQHDVCLGRLHFDGQVAAQFATSYMVARTRDLRIAGSKCTVSTPHEGLVIVEPADGKERRLIELPRNDTVLEQFEEFAECCRSGTTPSTGGLEGAQAVATMEALVLSAREGGLFRAIPTP